jgi:hypothetical protein
MTDQGYENELTRVWSRPRLYLLGNEPAIELGIYSHDRLLLTSHNPLSGLAAFVASVLGAMNGAVERLNHLSPGLASDAVDAETTARLAERAEKFRQLTAPSENKERQ